MAKEHLHHVQWGSRRPFRTVFLPLARRESWRECDKTTVTGVTQGSPGRGCSSRFFRVSAPGGLPVQVVALVRQPEPGEEVDRGAAFESARVELQHVRIRTCRV